MGWIDKEKLIREIKLRSYDVDVTWVVKFIDSFPNQPPIDFDALHEEWLEYIAINDYKETPVCFRDFLKSKNLCAPVKRELPVKTIYRIKPEFEAIFKDLGYDDYISECHDHLPENIKNVEKYYDKTTEPDYSAIPNGSVVEFSMNSAVCYRRVHSVDDRGFVNLYFEDYSDDAFKVPVSSIIRVVEWGERW